MRWRLQNHFFAYEDYKWATVKVKAQILAL